MHLGNFPKRGTLKMEHGTQTGRVKSHVRCDYDSDISNGNKVIVQRLTVLRLLYSNVKIWKSLKRITYPVFFVNQFWHIEVIMSPFQTFLLWGLEELIRETSKIELFSFINLKLFEKQKQFHCHTEIACSYYCKQ